MHTFERKGHRLRAVGRRDVCLLSNVIKPDGSRVVVLKKATHFFIEIPTALPRSKMHDPLTQDNPKACCERLLGGTTPFSRWIME